MNPILNCLETNIKHPIGKMRRNCPKCKKIYARKWRKTRFGKAWTKLRNKLIKNSPGYAAKKLVYSAVRSGQIPKVKTLSCLDCNKGAEVYDHRDYLKPLDVEPVCKACNYKRGPAKNN